MELGDKIKMLREQKNMTLEELGNAVGVGKSTVRKWENGMIKNMGRDKIAALAAVLQMSAVEFVPSITETEISTEDKERLEMLHQNPRLGLLFDRTARMTSEDVEFMLQFADRITKERDKD